MGQILHGCARTTAAIRRAIQHSQESQNVLAERHGINKKTVAKWRKRNSTGDAAMGPKVPHSIVLTPEEEAAAVAFRRLTLLPLDDCFHTPKASIPSLTRSTLHRCFQRHGVSRLAAIEGDKPARKTFKSYPIGFFHIDIAEVRTEEGKIYLFVGIDRTSKFVFAELHPAMDKVTAAHFLRRLLEAVPYKIHTILTDNGLQFADGPRGRSPGGHIFGRVCREHGIEHRLTKPYHPWTNGQVERMNRTLKEATPLRVARKPPQTPHGVSPCLQLRQTPQGSPGPHALRVHQEVLDIRATAIQE